GRALIEALDEAGYLMGETGEIAGRLNLPVARVEAVLDRLQQFDPPGVFARSLGECLALQLADRGRLDAAMQALPGHLDLLASGNHAAMCQRCGVNEAGLAAIMAELRRLDPRPGLAFDAESAVLVVPDIVIEPAPGTGWQIELSGEPRLAMNAQYPA